MRINAVRLVIMASAIAALPIHAQSFDCAKAAAAQERLICATPALRSLDSQLAKRYKRLMASLSPVARAEVLRGQREWLAYWPTSCRDGRAPLNPRSQEARACAERAYTERLGTLQSDTLVLGDILLYPSSRYRIARSTAGVEYTVYAQETAQTLRVDIDAVPPARRSVARVINTWLNGDGAGSATALDTDRDLHEYTSLTPSLPFLLSSSTSVEVMGHGAAHPLSVSSARHFHIGSNRPLRVSDIFTGTAWADVLAGMVEAELKSELEDGYFVESRSALKELIVNPERWSVAASGLTVGFNVYEVAPYALGAPSATIPWSALRPWLTEPVRRSLVR